LDERTAETSTNQKKYIIQTLISIPHKTLFPKKKKYVKKKKKTHF